MINFTALIESPEEKIFFEQIYLRYRKIMYYSAYQILKDEHLAEDAVHNAFMRLLNCLDKLDEVESNRTRKFVTIIAERMAINLYNKRKRRGEASYEELEELCSISYEKAPQNGNIVLELIKGLPLTYREIFLLKYDQGFDNHFISHLLDISENTLRQRIARGKKLLEGMLEKEGVYGQD